MLPLQVFSPLKQRPHQAQMHVVRRLQELLLSAVALLKFRPKYKKILFLHWGFVPPHLLDAEWLATVCVVGLYQDPHLIQEQPP